ELRVEPQRFAKLRCGSHVRPVIEQGQAAVIPLLRPAGRRQFPLRTVLELAGEEPKENERQHDSPERGPLGNDLEYLSENRIAETVVVVSERQEGSEQVEERTRQPQERYERQDRNDLAWVHRAASRAVGIARRSAEPH